MSWLYTVVFTSLLFSSQGGSVSSPVRSVSVSPAVVTNQIQDETEKFDQTYPLNANGRVNVSNINGSITVEAWDRNEVQLQYTKTADTKERLADVTVKIESKPDLFQVETDYGEWKKDKNGEGWTINRKLSVEFHLMVPRGAMLNEIETVNGSVAVSNFTNYTKVSAINGAVNATNLRGTANLSTVNGVVTAEFDQLVTGSKINLNTVNGGAKIVIPSDSNATLRGDSLNGVITNDFGLPVRKGKYVGRDLYGRVGTGDVLIRLSSVNGGLAIGRKNDGKTLNPATNLLQQKKNDDEDWDTDTDMDNDSMFKVEKINKEVAKAVKESSKVSAKAVADAQKQVNKMQPELAKITADSIERAAIAIEQTAKIIESEDFKQKVKEGMIKQKEGLAKLADLAFFPSVPRIEKKSESFPVKGVPKVTVEAKGCSVTVRGWDKNEVQYRVIQYSDPRNGAPLKLDETHTDTTVNIKVGNPNYEASGGLFGDGLRRVRIEIFVPRKSNLKINSNGEIRLEGVSGDIDLSGYDESVNVRDVDGTLSVSSSDGRIRVIGFKGNLVAESSDGMINLEGDFNRLKVRSSEGSIFVTLPDDTQASLEATCPDIKGEGIAITRIGGDAKISKYRIGGGGAPFEIETEGEIRVRGSGTLKESF